MNLTPSWHNSMNKTKILQSLQFQLTPTTFKIQQFQEASSLISLSNYLQTQESCLSISNMNRTARKIFKNDEKNQNQKDLIYEQRHQKNILQNQHEFNDENSESLLLLQSQIKENLSTINHETTISKQIYPQQKQYGQSRITQKVSSDRNRCTQSVQLLQLLEIPTCTSNKIDKSSSKIQLQSKQIQNLKSMYLSLLQSNQDLLKKFNSINQNNTVNTYKYSKKEDLLMQCVNCSFLQKSIKSIQTKLQQKFQQIKKYQMMIRKLNQTVFDLKLQNKTLKFQNQQYSQRFEKSIAKKRHEVKSSTKSKTFQNLDILEDTFFTQENDVLSSANKNPISSQKNSKYEEQIIYQHNFKNQFQDYGNKIYPQTPHPTPSYIKFKKHQRKPSNQSDTYLQGNIAISQVKQPTFYEMADIKVEKLIKEQTKYEVKQINDYITQRKALQELNSKHTLGSKCNFKNQKNLIRFSDLSCKNQNKQFIQKNQIASKKQVLPQSFQMIKNQRQKTPTKINAFLKVKAKDSYSSNNHLSNHPINKVLYEDNSDEKYQQHNSQTQSQTKTQKFYGQKNKNENDSYELNMNLKDNREKKSTKLLKNLKSHNILNVNHFNNSNCQKNIPLVYKSFKEIGELRQSNQDQAKRIEDNGTIQSLSHYKKLYPKVQKSQRFFSPSPQSYSSKRDFDEKSGPISSPYLKQRTQINTKCSLR